MKGAAWIAGSRILINFIGFASTVLLARLLLPDDFGIVAIAESVAAIVGSITELSLANALIQHDKPEKYHFDTAWTLNIARSFLLALVIVAIAFPAASAYNDPRLIPLLTVLAAATIVGGLENPKLITFQRELVFWQEFALSVASKVVAFVLAIAVAYVFRTYWALIVGSVAGQVTRVILSYIVLPYRPRFSLGGGRDLLSFSVWMTLSNAIRNINSRSDPMAIGFFISSSLLGYYSIGGKLAAMPVREGLGPVRKILFPAFSRMQKDYYRLREAYLNAQGLMCTLAFPISLGFSVLAGPIVSLFLGGKWLPAVPIIQILSVVAAINALESSHPLAMSLGRTRDLFNRDLRVFLIRLPLMIGGLVIGQHMSVGAIMGVIYGRALAAVINVAINVRLVRDIIQLPVRRQLANAFRPVAAAVIMYAGLEIVLRSQPIEGQSLVAFLRLFCFVLLGAGIYTAALVSLWLAQQRPNGPEIEIWKLMRQSTAKMVRRVRE